MFINVIFMIIELPNILLNVKFIMTIKVNHSLGSDFVSLREIYVSV